MNAKDKASEESFELPGEDGDDQTAEEPLTLDRGRVTSFAIALSHPTRIGIMLALYNDGPASSVMLFRRHLESLGNVSYHSRQLERAGAIEEVDAQAVRGSTEHFYDVSPFGHDVLRVAAEIGRIYPDPTA